MFGKLQKGKNTIHNFNDSANDECCGLSSFVCLFDRSGFWPSASFSYKTQWEKKKKPTKPSEVTHFHLDVGLHYLFCLKNKAFLGVPLWYSGLRIWCCHWYVAQVVAMVWVLIPGPGIFMSSGCNQKKKRGLSYLEKKSSMFTFISFFFFFFTQC